jgi:hypothetical protein
MRIQFTESVVIPNVGNPQIGDILALNDDVACEMVSRGVAKFIDEQPKKEADVEDEESETKPKNKSKK